MKLPLWRLLAGCGVLGGLLVVLVALAPVCIEDYRLQGYIKTLAARPSISDDAVRADLLSKAQELHLPVKPGDLKVSHPGGKRKIEAKYAVEMNLSLYQVNLHFHPSAER